MLFEGRIFVPENLARSVVLSQHVAGGHLGVKRLIADISRRYAWPEGIPLRDLAHEILAHEIRNQCVVCQACARPTGRCAKKSLRPPSLHM